MSGRRDESLVLDDALEAIERLIEIGTQARREFLGLDRDISEPILWNLVVLGESAKRLSGQLRGRFDEMPWSDMARTRDRITHRHDALDWVVVAEIIYDQLPPLLPRLIEIRDTMRAEFDAAEAERSE